MGRVLPFAKRRMVGPFIFFDQMGPVDFAPGIPHELEVRPHSERLEHARMQGVHMYGIQAWVALPNGDEEIDARFWQHPADSLPGWTEAGLRGRTIAGAAEGMDAGVKVNSPIFYMHWDMDTDASRGVPGEHAERAVYLADGASEVAGQALMPGQMAVVGKGDVCVTALAPSTVMVLGGEPVGERFIFWKFVSSSKTRVQQAKEDRKQGRLKLPDGDNAEFTPLPEG